jgi:hypothetical protein
VAETARRADTRAKPQLEVVAPMLAVDPRATCSRFALVIATKRKRPAGSPQVA